MDDVRSVLHTSGIPLSFWGEACQTMVCTLNRVASRTLDHQIPFFYLWCSEKPSVEHLRIFGCRLYAHIDKQIRNKLEPKSHLCYFLGYCSHTKTYRLRDAVSPTVRIRRDVLFDESILYGHDFPNAGSSTPVPFPVFFSFDAFSQRKCGGSSGIFFFVVISFW